MHFNYFACATIGHGFAIHVDANDFSFSRQYLFNTEHVTMRELGLEVIRTVRAIDGTIPEVDGLKALKVLDKMMDDAIKASGCEYEELMELPAWKVMSMVMYINPFGVYK